MTPPTPKQGIMEISPYVGGDATGDGLARSVCAFIAIFWGVRLVVALIVFDANEFLTTWYFKVGYHLLTVTFIYQTVAYGYCAIF